MIKERLDMDAAMEHDIDVLGLNYPRVLPREVDALLEQVVYDVHICPETTTTVVSAILPMKHIRWTLCSEIMACIDPRNYNAELGRKYGIEKAKAKAKDELWKLLGFKLAMEMVTEPFYN